MNLKKLAKFFEYHAKDVESKFKEYLTSSGISGVDADIYSSALTKNLYRSLFGVTHKALISQFKSIQKEVDFDSYCESLIQKEVREYLFSRYPVMFRYMDVISNNWLKQSCLLVKHFEKDKLEIQSEIFENDETLRIKTVRFGLGDLHRQGKSVSIIEFDNNSRIVYKPRALSIDIHFQKLISWVNELIPLKLFVPKTLNKGVYGWVEFVEYKSCKSKEEIDEYYWRLGVYVCLLYMINGTDFHYENIIASGSHPVLIDLESFFHPDLPGSADSINELDNSVLSTGIIPSYVDLAERIIPDISGITDVTGTEGVFNSTFLVPDENEHYKFVKEKGTLPGAENIPQLKGEIIQLNKENVRKLKDGFSSLYKIILDNLTSFKASLASFEEDNIRVLFRFTACYSLLLTESNHPNLMRSEKVIKKHFENLSITIQDYETYGQLISHEISDMMKLDVPLFTTKVNSKHLWYSDNNYIENFFHRSGFENVLNKLDKVNLHDLNYQLWIIDNSLSLQSELINEIDNPKSSQGNKCIKGYTTLEQRLLGEAERIAEHLEKNIYESNGFITWMVVKSVSLDNSKLSFNPSSVDLYGGMPGEILFLKSLAKLTKIRRYKELSDKAFRTLISKVKSSPESIDSIGLYYGWGAIINTLLQLARIEEDTSYLKDIEYLFEVVDFESLIRNDTNYSLIKGAAGFIIACSDYYLESRAPEAMRLAMLSAKHLLEKRQESGPGFSWRIQSEIPLSGLAHGVSGFAVAFAKLFQISKKEEYELACLSCLEYERTLFIKEEQNWRDCRDIVISHCQDEPFCSVGWSHGAPGIGLSRLAIIQAGINSKMISEELNIALKTTINKGFHGNHTLIFGSFGNLELLINYNIQFDNEFKKEEKEIISRLLQQLDETGWDLGEKNGSSFGLLIGVTGIGYQCLRALHRDKVPSLLISSKFGR